MIWVTSWDSDMADILLLLHLLPPAAQGRKKPGQMSACQEVGTSVQQHLDSITQSSQPYLLALGSTKSSIHSYFVVIDKHAVPCKATASVGAFDELFKAHFVFGQFQHYGHGCICGPFGLSHGFLQ
ncbi:uncharacterized protein ACWYII_040816 isoform 2-T2 [Salvelinus alpinus]